MPSGKNPDEPGTELAEVVNLRLARKARKRREAEAAAGRNRVLHGLSKAERKVSEAERNRTERHLDNLRRTPGDPER